MNGRNRRDRARCAIGVERLDGRIALSGFGLSFGLGASAPVFNYGYSAPGTAAYADLSMPAAMTTASYTPTFTTAATTSPYAAAISSPYGGATATTSPFVSYGSAATYSAATVVPPTTGFPLPPQITSLLAHGGDGPILRTTTVPTTTAATSTASLFTPATTGAAALDSSPFLTFGLTTETPDATVVPPTTGYPLPPQIASLLTHGGDGPILR